MVASSHLTKAAQVLYYLSGKYIRFKEKKPTYNDIISEALADAIVSRDRRFESHLSIKLVTPNLFKMPTDVSCD